MIHLTFVIAGNTPGAPPPQIYKDAAKRFADTYRQFPPDQKHRLILINSNGGLTDDIAAFFDGITYDVVDYNATGWDIGAHLYAVYGLPADDWVMCFSSWAHFRQRGWLKAFADARDAHGDGFYGSMVSFEHRPHIRGTGFFARCGRIQRYPHGCNSKIESLKFEVGPKSITNWFVKQGFGAWVVTPSGVYSFDDARSISEGFRRGGQSNIWTYDKHTAIFDAADDAEKRLLTSLAYDFENSPGANTGILLLPPDDDDSPERRDQLFRMLQDSERLAAIEATLLWRLSGPLRSVRRFVRAQLRRGT